MKKALALVLAFILSMSVFAGMTVFAEEIYFSPYTIYIDFSGYKYNNAVENITAEIYELGYIASETRYHLEDADGAVAEGKIKAGIAYKFIFELKLINHVSLDDLTTEKTYLNNLKASDIYKNGEWYVIVFQLSKLDAVLQSIDFFMEGYQIGTHVDDIVFYSDNDLILNISRSFHMASDRPSAVETGVIKGGINYGLSVVFRVPEGMTAFGMNADKIVLHMPDGTDIESMGIIKVNDSYITSFTLPNLDPSFITVVKLDFDCSGYAFGNSADDLSVVSETEGVTVSGITVKCAGTPPTEDSFQEFHGEFRDNTRYRVEISVRLADGYRLADDLPRQSISLVVDNQGGSLVGYHHSDEGYIIIMNLPIIFTNPTLEEKWGADFTISGYELGASVDDIAVTVDDSEIEIREVSFRNALTGEYCTEDILEGIKYEVMITAYTPGGWNVSRVTIMNYTLNIGEFSHTAITTIDSRVMTFIYDLPVFGEIIPVDPDTTQYDPISAFDLQLSGYELGNDSKDVTVTSDIEGLIIRKVSFKTPDGKAYDGPIEAGKRYQVTVTASSLGGWESAAPSGAGRYFKLEGISPSDGGFVPEAGDSGRLSQIFVYYVHALAPGDGVENAGDMDGDGEITVSDALRSLRIAAGLDAAVMPKSTRSTILGDVDGDKGITVADSLAILRKAVKLA